MSRKNIDVGDGKITPIESRNIGGVFMALTLDTRYPRADLSYPIAVRVIYLRKIWYYQTGTSATIEDYPRIVRAGTQGKWHEQKQHLLTFFNYIETNVKALITEGFSLEKLKERVGKRSASAKTDLFAYWQCTAESKSNIKTKQQYLTSLSSFKKFRSDVKLLVADVTVAMINDWKEAMEEAGNSHATQSIYLRALRAVLNSAKEEKIIVDIPKFQIPTGSRRVTNFIPVADILKLKTFVAPKEWTETEKRYVECAIDWWLILYCCNGCNTIDLANLKWNDDFFYDNELSFVRSKIKNKKAIEVRIPIIPELKELLDKHGSTPEKGKLVFPQIRGNATTEVQMDNRVHDFNKKIIREWLVLPCEKLEIRPISAQFARNSFITCLTHHGVSDSYIDKAVGHADNLLRGYQGGFSKKKRLEFNKLLFLDPESED